MHSKYLLAAIRQAGYSITPRHYNQTIFQIISARLWNNQLVLVVSQGIGSQATTVHKHITKILRG